MMSKFKRIFVFVVFCCMSLVFATGFAEAKTLRFYAPYPNESFITQGLVEAIDEIKEKTNGKITIRLYPGMQLGGYEEAVEEVRQGTIDFAATWLTQRFDPRLDLLNIPGYAPFGNEQLEEIVFGPNSPFVGKIDEILKELGITSLGPWPEPFPSVMFAKGKTPANVGDYENKKTHIRVPAMPLYRDTYTALGYQTVTMDLSEVWNAMQTGQVDGVAGLTLEDAWIQGKDIIESYIVLKVLCPPQWLIANTELWESFSAEERKIITEAIAKAAAKTLALMGQKDQEYIENLTKYGIKVIQFDNDWYVKTAEMMRDQLWPKYYSLYGEDFLKALDKTVREMNEKYMKKQ